MGDEPRKEGPWLVHGEETAFENPWMRVATYPVTQPDGTQGTYGVVRFQGLALGVLPLDEAGNTWIVGQHRFALGLYSWELPEGGGAKDVAPRESALRELAEETGLRAGTMLEIGVWYTSNSITDEKAIAYIATDLTQGALAPDPTEVLELRKLPFSQLLEMVLEGEISDAFTVMMVTTAYIKAQRGLLPAHLCRLLLS